MKELSKDGDIYTQKWLKQKLKDRYKADIFFTDEPGRSNLACFKDMASSILTEKWYQDRKNDVTEESKRVIAAAVKLIKNEVRCTQYSTDVYRSQADIQDTLTTIPPSLIYFLQLLLPTEILQGSIGQCILKALKPRTFIPPLLFALGVAVDHAFGSKWLVNELARLGFSISYSEVKRFKQSAMVDEKAGEQSAYQTSNFCQWVGDNVDHNINTLNGKGTFHGMGIIACSIDTGNMTDCKITRQDKIIKKNEIIKNRGIQIHWYNQPAVKALSKTLFKPRKELYMPLTFGYQLNVDVLWHCAGVFRKTERLGTRPSWNCYMHLIKSSESSPQKSSITMLPIIDMNPGDYSCLYSTLLFC